MNSNLEFEFKRNSTTRVQTSNINLKSKRKDHVYKLMLKHGAKTTLVWINFKTQTKQCKNYSKNYHKLFMISRAHDKKMTPRNNKNML